MHILDFLMYFVLLFVIMWLLDKISDGQFTEGLGGVVGLAISIIYTIFYISMFWVGDYNWIDIFRDFILNITW